MELEQRGKSLTRFITTILQTWSKVYIARRAICQGVALIMFSNVVYILNNYVVSWFNLNATEVAMARGVIQVPVFALVLMRNRRQIIEGGLIMSIIL